MVNARRRMANTPQILAISARAQAPFTAPVDLRAPMPVHYWFEQMGQKRPREESLCGILYWLRVPV